MAIQFGQGVLVGSGQEFGYLQDVTLDFEFEDAELHAGNGLYPIDVRIHSASISGNAGFADIDVEAFQHIVGGTKSGTSLLLTGTSRPSYFQLVFTLTTDSISFIVTLYRVKSTKLSMAFNRTNHFIPNFDFKAYARSDGNVGIIDCGDVS